MDRKIGRTGLLLILLPKLLEEDKTDLRGRMRAYIGP